MALSGGQTKCCYVCQVRSRIRREATIRNASSFELRNGQRCKSDAKCVYCSLHVHTPLHPDLIICPYKIRALIRARHPNASPTTLWDKVEQEVLGQNRVTSMIKVRNFLASLDIPPDSCMIPRESWNVNMDVALKLSEFQIVTVDEVEIDPGPFLNSASWMDQNGPWYPTVIAFLAPHVSSVMDIPLYQMPTRSPTMSPIENEILDGHLPQPRSEPGQSSEPTRGPRQVPVQDPTQTLDVARIGYLGWDHFEDTFELLDMNDAWNHYKEAEGSGCNFAVYDESKNLFWNVDQHKERSQVMVMYLNEGKYSHVSKIMRSALNRHRY